MCLWFYWRKDDYYTYLVEFKYGNDKKGAVDQFLKAYQLFSYVFLKD